MIIAICEITLVLLLFWGAAFDVYCFRLPNWLTGATAVAAVAATVVTADSPLDISWHLGFGLGVFLVGLGMFHFNLLGGGDVKWIGALAIWIGPHLDFLRFIILMGVAGGVLAALVFLFRRVRPEYGRDGGRTHLPYGVAIAIAGLEYWLRQGFWGRDLLSRLAG